MTFSGNRFLTPENHMITHDIFWQSVLEARKSHDYTWNFLKISSWHQKMTWLHTKCSGNQFLTSEITRLHMKFTSNQFLTLENHITHDILLAISSWHQKITTLQIKFSGNQFLTPENHMITHEIFLQSILDTRKSHDHTWNFLAINSWH